MVIQITINKIIKIIDERIALLKAKEKDVPNIEQPRKRHPAFKQIKGRILELQHIKNILIKEQKFKKEKQLYKWKWDS